MKAIRQQIINFVYGVATGTKRIRLLLTPLFALIFSSIVLLLIFASFYLDYHFELPKYTSKPFNLVFSVPLLIGGIALWVWCAVKFFKTKGTPVPVNPPPKLVTDGPYAWSRNPMMTGLFMAMAGIGILFGSITLTFIMTPLFVFMSILEFKFIEEPELEKRFGNKYREYKKKTPIVIPKICPR